MVETDADITIRIPASLKRKLEATNIDVEGFVRKALESLITELNLWPSYQEISLPSSANVTDLQASDIPPGHFIRIPGIDLEGFERLTDESCWEYLGGVLIHHSPESEYHNAILELLIHKAKTVLDPSQYRIRSSRIALSIGQNKPEPDLMIFDRENYTKKKRKDGSDSEVFESPPLLVVEISSKSSAASDEWKGEQYRIKGVQEYWWINTQATQVTVMVRFLEDGQYASELYEQGEIQSRVVPPFSVSFGELNDPDSF